MFYFDVRLNIININSECTGNSKWMPGGFWHLVCCKAYRGLCQEQSTAIFHLPWEKNERKSLTWNENTNLQSCRQSLCPRMPNAFKYKSSSLADGKRQEVNQLFRVSPGPNTGAGGVMVVLLKPFFPYNQGPALSHAVLQTSVHLGTWLSSPRYPMPSWVGTNR